MKKKRIFVFVGNPDKDSFSTALADAYVRGARGAGHEVRLTHIADMQFDPILRHGYKVVQTLEPDLIKFQEDVKWCEHFVTICPIWWSSVPALMKGLIDRAWTPGFAYNFRKGIIPGWYRRLCGRSARVIVTSDTHPTLLWILFGGTINHFTRAVLRFSGFKPLRRTWLYGMRKFPEHKAESFLARVERLGRKGK